MNQVKIESMPDEQHSSIRTKTSDCGQSDHDDAANNVPVFPVNEQNATLVPVLNETTVPGASVSTGGTFSPLWLPQEDPLFYLVQLHATTVARRKRRMFNVSFVCPQRWAALCPSDRMRLYELIQLRADAMNEAVMYLNIPPFPTESEMARLLAKRKKNLLKRFSKTTAKPDPLAQKPVIGGKATLKTGSTLSSQKKSLKASQAKQPVIKVSERKNSKQAGGKRTSAKRCD